MIHIGYTGTRNGMTPAQRRSVGSVAFELVSDCADVSAHHGDCDGGDKEFHGIASELGCRMIGHPSTHNLRAYCKFDVEHERLPPLVRNGVIVDVANFMIAAPYEMTEQHRGGTWATVRMARRAGKALVIVYADGTAVKERWP